MSDDIVYRYDERKDPSYVAPSEGNEAPEWQRTYITGVPLIDLRQADLDALAEWQQESVANAPYFVAVKEPTKKRKAKAEPTDAPAS